MDNLVISVIRTGVATLWGFLATLLLRWGINIDSAQAIQATMALVSIVVYAVLRFLEEKFPAFGIVFGIKAKPEYAKPE